MNLTITPIGYVEAERLKPRDDFWGGATSTIVLSDDFGADALDGIEDYSHVEIIFLFHEVPLDKIVTGARHPRGNPDWPVIGIFAQRAKGRPNRLGTTICRVLGRDGNRLFVGELDAIHGTPLLDLKPVMREFLPREDVSQPLWATELMREYWSVPEELA